MEPLEAMDALARQARRETPPTTDVRIGAVFAAAGRERTWRIAPLAWSAAMAAVAAVVVLSFALHQNQSSSVDGITPLFSAAQIQLPQ
jgi:hypothetical protein